MRVPKINLHKYQKSSSRTQKVMRTISKTKPYVYKTTGQEVETEREIFENLKQQKEFDKEFLENIDKMLEAHRVNEIQYYALLLYGIKLDKEKIIEILKARKAK